MSLWSRQPRIDHDRVVAAIAAAESRTSGEIRVLLARHKAADPVAAAQGHFGRLGLDRTRRRNAVLIFVAPRSRTFAIIGDTGVHEKCGDAFWREVAAAMAAYFKRGDFTDGLVHGIERAGTLLAAHFPPESGAGGEPPDTVGDVD
jgi:uncharacterized membrane protein